MKSTMAVIPNALYCALINLRCLFRGQKLRVSLNDENLFVGKAGDATIIFAQPNRYYYYKRGLKARLQNLAQDYVMERVSFKKGDTVIDCGANIGEIGLYLANSGVDYHGFEPEEKEARCCDLNNFDGEKQTNRLALWNENTTLKFYSKPDSADSSAFPTQDNLEVFEIPAITLSHYVKEHGIEHIRFAKIEAEGAEPEVLEGALDVLGIIDYISVDCGFERGKEKASTFEACNEILINSGFEIVGENVARRAFLFKRIDP